MKQLHLTRRFVLSAALMFGLMLSFAISMLGTETASAASPTSYQTTSGQVSAKGSNTFAVKAGTKTLTFKVTPATQFIQNGKPVTFANLKVGMLIGLLYNKGNEGKYEALRVYLPTVQRPEYNVTGVVTAKGEHDFTLKMGDRLATFKVTPATQFKRGDQAASFADLKVGMSVAVVVTLSAEGNAYEAVRVLIPAV